MKFLSELIHYVSGFKGCVRRFRGEFKAFQYVSKCIMGVSTDLMGLQESFRVTGKGYQGILRRFSGFQGTPIEDHGDNRIFFLMGFKAF